eukprot:271293-Amphidinium_carterae.1
MENSRLEARNSACAWRAIRDTKDDKRPANAWHTLRHAKSLDANANMAVHLLAFHQWDLRNSTGPCRHVNRISHAYEPTFLPSAAYIFFVTALKHMQRHYPARVVVDAG